MIAMALALEPKLLIADEPTTALDVTTQAQILKLIDNLRRKHGTAVLFITHDLGVVAEIADRIAVLQKGVLVEEGTADQVLGAPRHAYTQKLLAAVPSLTPPERPPLPTTARRCSASRGWARPIASARFFGAAREVKAADDISFTLVARRDARPRRRIRLRQIDRRALLPAADRARSAAGSLLERAWRSPSSAQRDAARAAQAHPDGVPGPVRLAQSAPDGRPHHRRRAGRAWHGAQGGAWRGRASCSNSSGFRPMRSTAIRTNSPAASASASASRGRLRSNPMCWSPTRPVSALDVSVQAQILTLIKDIQQRLGLAILFVTHDLRVAAQICDRIAVMQRGRIVETRPTAALFADPQHDYTRQLLAAVPGSSRFKN